MKKSRTYVLDSVEYREENPSPGMVIISDYSADTVTPSDYYARKKSDEWIRIMKAAGVHCEVCWTRRRLLSPSGTGPGGSVRFMDDHIPEIVRLYVQKHDTIAATDALASHQLEVDAWIEDRGPRPAAWV